MPLIIHTPLTCRSVLVPLIITSYKQGMVRGELDILKSTHMVDW